LNNRSKWRQLWWRLLLCAALMLWIFHGIFMQEGRQSVTESGGNWSSLTRSEQWQLAWQHGPRELWGAVRLVSPLAFLISLGFMGITLLLGALRWQRLLHTQDIRLPYGRTLEISLVAHFFNSFLLGSTGGDLFKAYYAARETHHQKTEAVTTVLADRMIGLFSMLLFAAIMLLFNVGAWLDNPTLVSFGGLIAVLFVGSAVFCYLAFFGGVSKRFPQIRELLKRLPKADVLERSLNSCRRFGENPRALLVALVYSMALNAFCVFQVYAVAGGLSLTVGLQALLFIVPAIICLSAIPITPSGLGVRENLFVLLLAAPQFGVPNTQALTLSLLTYAGSLIWSLVGGAVYLSFREKHHPTETESGA
jgi:glycosyltransferase 2 family protein